MHSCKYPGFSTLIWKFCVEQLQQKASFCLLPWSEATVHFLAFLGKKKVTCGTLSYDSEVLIPWLFPVSQHQAYHLATAAVDEMCSFTISLGSCYLLFSSYSKWTGYTRCIQRSLLQLLPVGVYSAPFVYSLNVHSHPLIFLTKVSLEVPQNENISRASAFTPIFPDSGFLIWNVYFLTHTHSYLHFYLYQPQLKVMSGC